MFSHVTRVEPQAKIHGYIKQVRNLRILGVFSVMGLLLLFASFVFPFVNRTDEAKAAYAPSVSSIDIISASTTASVDITPASTVGTFASSGTGSEVSFGVTTNNLTGYTVAIAARSGDISGQLTNASYSDTIDSISAIATEDDFRTGATSTYTNKWGIKPDKVNSALNSDYLPAPTTSEIVLETTNSPNPTTANTYTIGLGARVDYTKPVGTYTNTYVLQAVGNQISYQITYSDTTGDTAVTPTLPSADGANDIEASGFTLSSTVPARTGYTFAGWCDGTVTHVASGNSTCTPDATTGAPGTTYVAGASYTFNSLSSSSTNLATLYAMWNVKTYSLTANFTANTGVSSVKVCTVAGNCSGANLKGTISATGGSVLNLAYGATYYLYPTFNISGYELYSWAKTSSTGTLSSTTAANPTFTMGPGNGVVTVAGGLYMQNVTSSICTTTPKTAYDKRDRQSYVIQKLADGNCWMMTNLNLGATTLTTDLTSANTNITTTVTAATFNGWKKPDGIGTVTYIAGEFTSLSGTDPVSKTPYGSLYNYCAVTGGTYCYDDGTNHGDATVDICPAGWRLPTGLRTSDDSTYSGEYYALYTNAAYDTYEEIRAPYTSGGAAFALAGEFSYSTTEPGPRRQGEIGCYWSSSISGMNIMQNFYIGEGSSSTWFAINAGGDRHGGRSMRCILK